MRPQVLTVTFALLASASAASAMTAAPVTPTGRADIIRVADGCGLGFHVNRRGICRPNGERVVVEPRPVIVEPRPVYVESRPAYVERPVVVEPRAVVVVPRPDCGLRIGPLAVRGPC